MAAKFIRTCQSCLHEQEDKDPAIHYPKGLPDSYLNRACDKCKSEDLDYGSYKHDPEEIHDPEDE